MSEKKFPSDRQSPTAAIPPRNAGYLFQLTAICAGAFLVTVLAMIATAIGDSGSPAAAWLMRQSGGLMAMEVAAILIFGFAAMTQDRVRTQRQQREEQLRQTNSLEAPVSVPKDESPEA